jgi:hypothetical protein
MMSDEHLVVDGDASTDKRVARNLAASSDDGVLLDLDEAADARVIPDRAPVEIGEPEDLDAASQADIRRDPIERLHHRSRPLVTIARRARSRATV